MTVTGIYGNTIAYRGDDIAHLAYINEFKAHFPPQNFGFAGVPLKGYHFFYDFLMAKTSLITTLSNESLYFHLYPLFISLLWGIGVYALLVSWTKKVSAGLWGVLFSFFGGSFGFILRLQGRSLISSGNVFGIDQPASALMNPPFSISVVFVITTLLIIYHYLQSRNKFLLFPLALCVGLTAMFKVYAGMIVLGGFLFLAALEILKKRPIILLAGIATAILFLGTFGVFLGKGQFLIYYPLWEPHKVLVANLPWYGYEEKIYTYSRLHVIRGIIETELYGLNLYFLGNLGTRVIGLLVLFFLFLERRKASFFSLVLLVMILVSILIPLFFIQSGKVFEIIQLAWYYPILCSLFAAFGISYFFEAKINSLIKILFAVVLIVFTLQSAYEHYLGTIRSYFFEQRGSLESPYFKTMDFLKSHGTYDDTVLELPPKEKYNTDLYGRWYFGTSPHLTAFANKRSYLNYEFLLFPNLDVKPRINFLQKILKLETMAPEGEDFLSLRNEVEQTFIKNKISFIYSEYPVRAFQKSSVVKKAYSNSSYFVYEVKKN